MCSTTVAASWETEAKRGCCKFKANLGLVPRMGEKQEKNIVPQQQSLNKANYLFEQIIFCILVVKNVNIFNILESNFTVSKYLK